MTTISMVVKQEQPKRPSIKGRIVFGLKDLQDRKRGVVRVGTPKNITKKRIPIEGELIDFNSLHYPLVPNLPFQ